MMKWPIMVLSRQMAAPETLNNLIVAAKMTGAESESLLTSAEEAEAAALCLWGCLLEPVPGSWRGPA